MITFTWEILNENFQFLFSLCFLRFPETLRQIDLVNKLFRYNPDSIQFHTVVLRIREGTLTSSYKHSLFEVLQYPVSFLAFYSFALPQYNFSELLNWSHLLEKFLMEKLLFLCSVCFLRFPETLQKIDLVLQIDFQANRFRSKIRID